MLLPSLVSQSFSDLANLDSPIRGEVGCSLNVSITMLMKAPNIISLQPIGKRLTGIEHKLESTMFFDLIYSSTIEDRILLLYLQSNLLDGASFSLGACNAV